MGFGGYAPAQGGAGGSSSGGAPDPHAASHEEGGSDELDVTALGGYPGGVTNFLREDGAFAAPGGGTIDHTAVGGSTTIRKTATESVISSATLQDCDDFSVDVVSGRAYVVEWLLFTESDNVGGVKIANSGTCTVSGSHQLTILSNTCATGGSAFYRCARVQGLNTGIDVNGGGPGGMNTFVHAWAGVEATGDGTFTLQFAQNVSDGDPAKIGEGSVMRITRTA